MCRASNCCEIDFGHMSWEGDCLGIKFSHMKNDQTGDMAEHTRCVYANPFNRAICPILHLATYMAVFGFKSPSRSSKDSVNKDRLFPGTSQYSRYNKSLKSALSQPVPNKDNGDVPCANPVGLEADVNPRCSTDASEEANPVTILNSLGVVVGDIGSHSARKGAATFCTSGSTYCPNCYAVQIRGGWSMYGVTGTYHTWEAAGDQYVGRVLAGLNINSHTFAVQAPHFRDRAKNMGLIQEGIELVYPGEPENGNSDWFNIAEHLLASLVYHHDYIVDKYPEGHELLRTGLFTTRDMYEKLAAIVECKIARASDIDIGTCYDDDENARITTNEDDSNLGSIRVTGIPPHCLNLVEMKEAREENAEYAKQILANQTTQRKEFEAYRDGEQARQKEQTAAAVQGVNEMLQDQGVRLNQVTHQGMEKALETHASSSAIEHNQRLERIEITLTTLANREVSATAAINDATNMEIAPAADEGPPVHYWGEDRTTKHTVPIDWQVPRGKLRDAFNAYMMGIQPTNDRSGASDIMPLRFINTADVPTSTRSSERKLLNKYLACMKAIEMEVKSADDLTWHEKPSVTQLNEMFAGGERVLVLDEVQLPLCFGGATKRKRSTREHTFNWATHWRKYNEFAAWKKSRREAWCARHLSTHQPLVNTK